MAAILLIAAGVWAGRHAGAPEVGSSVGNPVAMAAAGSQAGNETAIGTRAVQSQAYSTARAAQAEADGQAAQSAAMQAAQAAQHVEDLLTSAQSAFSRLQSLASPALARQPSAADPAGALDPLTTAASEVSSAVSTVQQESSSAADAARGAVQIAAQDADARQAASDAAAAAQNAEAALHKVQHEASQVSSWVQQAQAAITAWQKVHDAPPGYFGVEFASPPADWTVQGCEVISAYPGGPAAQAGLIGRNQRTDPVGDVITSIADATDGNASWPVTSCAALKQAIAQTRSGDQVTIGYFHRQVVLLYSQWESGSGSTTLTNGANPACPSALTGTITPELVGNRITLDINLSGPAGIRSGLDVILDTGGVDTIFPDELLRSVGYTPFATMRGGGVVPGATDVEYLYHVAGDAITVRDQGVQVPLATGTLTVIGIQGGTDYGLGPDILKHGAKLSTSGDRWTLTPPCG